jgi:very-short-patch-repair endonuclease
VHSLPRVITAAGAARLGFTEARVRTELRRGRWQWLASGVLLTRPDEPTRDDWIHAGLALAAYRCALTGWDAVRLRGIGPNRPPDPTVLILTEGGRNRRVGGVHLRPTGRPFTSTTLSPIDEHLPSVPVVAVPRAVCDTAVQYRALAPVRALVTASVQRGLCTASELAAELDRAPRNGSAPLRRALVDVLAGAHSIAEAEAIELLHDIGRHDFVANAPVHDAQGQLLYTVDLLWPSLAAIVEIDSREFHFGEDEWKATMARHNVLTGLGYAVTHYPPSDIRRRRRAWALEVAAWLDARAATLR